MFSVIPNPGLSIHKRLLWAALLPYLIVVLGFAGYSVYGQTVWIHRAYEHKTALMAQRLAYAVSTGLDYWNGDRLRAWLSRQPEQGHVSQVSIYDLHGRELALFSANTASASGGGDNLTVDEPILNQERVIGRIRLVWSPDYFHDQLVEGVGSVAIMLGIALGILVWIREYLIHYHIRPLRLLNERFRRWVVQDTPLDHAPPVDGNDFNSICNCLDVLVRRMDSQRERYAQKLQKLTLEVRRLQYLLEDRKRALDTVHALSDMERRARLLFLTEVESELRPLLLAAAGEARQFAHSTGQTAEVPQSSPDLIETFDGLIRDWREYGLNPEYGLHDFDPRACLERLVGVLMASLPNITLILAVSPDIPEKLYGDPSRITQILMHWIIQLGRVMHHGQLVIRARVSTLRGEPGWLIVIHAPLADISAEVRESLSFLFSTGHVLYTDTQGNRNRTSVASVIQALNGRYGVFSGMVEGVFCSMNLPLGRISQQETTVAGQGMSLCVIDGDPVSRKAWVWQLMSLGIRPSTCEGLDSVTQCIASGDRLKIIIMNQQNAFHKSSRLELFAESCRRVEAWPVLILPYGDLEGRDYYRKKGAICLNQPISSADWQNLILDLQKPVAGQSNERTGHTVLNSEREQSGMVESPSSRPETRIRSCINPSISQGEDNLAQAVLAATRNNTSLAITLLNKLLEEWPGQILAVDGALESGRWQEARDITHQINGAASLCGFSELRDSAYALESILTEAIDSGQVPDYPAGFSRVRMQINELLVAARQLLLTFAS